MLRKGNTPPLPKGVPSWTARAPAWADLLPSAKRFFARLLAFDIACPECGEVSTASRQRGRVMHEWDPRISRFRCSNCKAQYTLGIVAWPVEPYQRRVVPPDAVPDYAQSIRLTLAAGHEIPPKKPDRQAYDGANVLIAQEDK